MIVAKLHIVNCRVRLGRRCMRNVTPTPSYGWCEGCSSRSPIDPACPAVDHEKRRAERLELKRLGPATWGQLHERPWIFDGDAEGELLWLEQFASRINCVGCLDHWLKIVREHPAVLTNAHAYATWGIDRHDEVNISIGKPAMGREVALRQWTAVAGRPLPA